MPKKKRAAKNKNVLERFTLKNVRLVESVSRLSIHAQQPPGTAKLDVACHYGTDRDSKTLLANVSCAVESQLDPEVDAADQSQVVFKCTYQSVYECRTKRFPSQKTLEEASDQVVASAILQLWPFVRHHIHWLSVQSGLPALLLPMFLQGDPGEDLLGSVGDLELKKS